jgi:hypothetical protein
MTSKVAQQADANGVYTLPVETAPTDIVNDAHRASTIIARIRVMTTRVLSGKTSLQLRDVLSFSFALPRVCGSLICIARHDLPFPPPL